MSIRKSKNIYISLLSLSTVLLSTLPSPAEMVTISTADGDGADAQIRGLIGTDDQSATNFGSSSGLAYRYASVGTTGVNRFQKSLIRFDLPDNIDTVNSATLRLYSTSTSSKDYDLYGLRELSDYGPGQLDESWGESTVNWDNAPFHEGIGSNSNGLASGTFVTLLNGGSTPSSPGTEIYSSAALASFIEDDTNGLVTFLIRADNNETSVGNFASKEHDGTGFTGLHAPQLVLEYTVVPEPSAFALAGLGFGLFGLRRFRHRKSA